MTREERIGLGVAILICVALWTGWQVAKPTADVSAPAVQQRAAADATPAEPPLAMLVRVVDNVYRFTDPETGVLCYWSNLGGVPALSCLERSPR